MNTQKQEYVITFTEKMLGTVPKDPEIYKSYIAGLVDPETADEECQTVEKTEEKGWTGFHIDNGKGLFIYDYMIKGFLKSAIAVLMSNKDIKKIPAYKKWVDTLIFIFPRKIYFDKEAPDGSVERPLRAMTAQGPRVTLTRSDYIAENTEIKVIIELVSNDKGITWDVIEKALDYGRYVGLGQWRGSGGYGRFEFKRT